MKKLAIAFSSKDQVELTRKTYTRLMQTIPTETDVYWGDGSEDEQALQFFEDQRGRYAEESIKGGPDAAIVWKLSTLLNAPQHYELIGLMESDVLLDEDWFWPTIELFEKGKADGLSVGAVSPRSYVDRVLVQRDGYAVMHNIGAGAIIFTREAAEIALRTFRTHWWPHNVNLFAQLSGIDLRTYAAFRGNEQWTTTDWGWEAQLARNGLASLALTPAKCQMIGQNPPLKQQGLELCGHGYDPMHVARDEGAFKQYRMNLKLIRGGADSIEFPGTVHREGSSMLFFPHQLEMAGGRWQGTLELKHTQGFGPFSYRAGPGGASLSVHVSGSCSYLVGGGAVGAIVTIEDHRSGFKASPNLPYEQGQPITVNVPGSPVPRLITMKMDEGAVFYGLSCTDPQLIDTTFKFDWDQLPEAK